MKKIIAISAIAFLVSTPLAMAQRGGPSAATNDQAPAMGSGPAAGAMPSRAPSAAAPRARPYRQGLNRRGNLDAYRSAKARMMR